MRNARLCITSAVIYMIDYEEILQQIPVNTCFRSFLWPTLTFPMFAAVEMVTSSFKATCRAFLSKLWLIVEDWLPVIKSTSSIVTFFFKYYIVIWRGKNLDLNVCNCYTGNELTVLGCAVSLL